MLNISLRQEYFDAIKSGLNKPKFKELKPGMKIRFTSTDTNELIVCTIEALNVYTSF